MLVVHFICPKCSRNYLEPFQGWKEGVAFFQEIATGSDVPVAIHPKTLEYLLSALTPSEEPTPVSAPRSE